MTMKPTNSIIACFVALLAFTFVAGFSEAANETVTVAPSSSNGVLLGTMNEGDLLMLSWTSTDTPVSAILTGPSAYSKTYPSRSNYDVILTVPHDGAYTLTFTNPSSSITATVDLTYDVSPFNPIDTAGDILMWIAIISAIIVVVIVVIVVLVIVMGDKKKQAAGAPPAVVLPMVPGMCPVCGAHTDTNAQFCSKCGARFR